MELKDQKDAGKEIVKVVKKEFKDMGFWETIKDFPCRIASAVHKLIGVNGLILGLTIWMGYAHIIPDISFAYTWIVISMFIIFGRKSLDIINAIKK